MPLFLLFSETSKRGKNAPFLAYLLNALWYFEINLHFCLVVLDEQLNLNSVFAATVHCEPPAAIFVIYVLRIKAKGLMSICLIRSLSVCGVVVDFDGVVRKHNLFDEQAKHLCRLFSDCLIDEL